MNTPEFKNDAIDLGFKGYYIRHLRHTDGTFSDRVALVPCDGNRTQVRVYDTSAEALAAVGIGS